jgi:uncharacterized membrane protein
LSASNRARIALIKGTLARRQSVRACLAQRAQAATPALLWVRPPMGLTQGSVIAPESKGAKWAILSSSRGRPETKSSAHRDSRVRRLPAQQSLFEHRPSKGTERRWTAARAIRNRRTEAAWRHWKHAFFNPINIIMLLPTTLGLACLLLAPQTVPVLPTVTLISAPSGTGVMAGATAISLDGQVIFGRWTPTATGIEEPFRYELASSTFQGLGRPGSGVVYAVEGCDATGSQMVCNSVPTTGPATPYTWTLPGNYTAITAPFQGVTGISALGGVVSGFSVFSPVGPLFRAQLRHLPSSTTIQLPLPPTGFSMAAEGVSPMAQFTVGKVDTAAFPSGEAFLYDLFTNITIPLGVVANPGLQPRSIAYDVSDAGVPVGYSTFRVGGVSVERAAIFGVNNVNIDTAFNANIFSAANAISGDSRIVVGQRTDFGAGTTVAFMYDRSASTPTLVDLNASLQGLVPAGWTLALASDVSGNGRSICGTATGPGGQSAAVVVAF